MADSNNGFNFDFCIKSKRKFAYPENKITGKDGLKSLVWAYKCLKNTILFFKIKI